MTDAIVRRPLIAATLVLTLLVAGCTRSGPVVESPTPGASVAPTLTPLVTVNPRPAPPLSFDPADVPYFYYASNTGREGLWLGPIGRPQDATLLALPSDPFGGFGDASQLSDGSVVAVYHDGILHGGTLVWLAPGRQPIKLLDDVITIPAKAGAADVVFAARHFFDRDLDDGVWRVSLAAPPTQVLPALQGPGLGGRDNVASDADGQAVAASLCDLESGEGQLQVRFADAGPRQREGGTVLGFDPAGDLIAQLWCGGGRIMRFPRDGGPAEPLVPEGSGYQDRMTPNGRFLAVTEELVFPRRLVIIDLETGEKSRVLLPSNGWDIDPATTDRYIVLLDVSGDLGALVWTYAIHDLVDGWTGYLTFDGLPSPTGPTTPGCSPDARLIKIVETAAIEMVPDAFIVRRGETVCFEVTNTAGSAHTFYVGPAADVEARRQSERVAGIAEFSAGTRGLEYTFEGDGPFAYACWIPGHLEAGMKGEVILD